MWSFLPVFFVRKVCYYYLFFVLLGFINFEIDPICLAFTPLLDESAFSAQNHRDLILFVLSIFRKSVENLICIIGDNCNVNKALADLLEIPLVGCAAHRFNLAIQKYLVNYSEIINKVQLHLIYIIQCHQAYNEGESAHGEASNVEIEQCLASLHELSASVAVRYSLEWCLFHD
jgi:hypothetical protein